VTDPPSTPGPHRPTGAINQGPVEYKGAPLDSERGPGLGCFRIQMVVLVILIVLTPLTVGRVPEAVSALLLFATIALLLVSGQTIIFLLRLVSADRRGRRQPLAPRSPTVGQLEDTGRETDAATDDAVVEGSSDGPADAPIGEPGAASDEPADASSPPLERPARPDPPGSGPVRQ
jgi:hypothetical protein